MPKSERKSRYLGMPKQIHWEPELKMEFEKVIKKYDSELSTAAAIKKLIRWAVAENWLPGYIRQERVIDTGNVKALENLKMDKTILKDNS